MAFHPAKQNRGPAAWKPLEMGAEGLAAEAGEALLIDGDSLRQEGSDFWNGLAQSAYILRGGHDGNFQDCRKVDQQLGILDQPLFFKNRRQQFFLNIDDDQGAALSVETSAGELAGIAFFRDDVARSGDHVSLLWMDCTDCSV